MCYYYYYYFYYYHYCCYYYYCYHDYHHHHNHHQVYGRLKSMTQRVSDRDREQVVIDIENLKTISVLRHKNMGTLPPELNLLLVSSSHFICRLLAACTSFARAPPLELMRAGHSCVAMLNNIAAQTAEVQSSAQAVVKNLAATGNVLLTALYAIPKPSLLSLLLLLLLLSLLLF